jgi:hypothetical protein
LARSSNALRAAFVDKNRSKTMQRLVSIGRQLRGRYRPFACVAIVLLGSLALTMLWHDATATPAHWIYIQDDAAVLNQDRVIQAAGGVGYNIDLYTSNTLPGDATALAAFCRAHVPASQQGTVVIAIDTRNAALAIQDNGPTPENPVSFKPGQYQAAQRAFQQGLTGGNFTAATVALLQELSRAASTNRVRPALPWWGAMALVPVLVGALLALLFLPERDGQVAPTCTRYRRLTLLK